MHAVLNAALPIFAMIFTGFLCGRFGVLPPEATDSLNRFAIYLALPALMFLAMSRITPDQAGQVGFALAFAGGIAMTFGLGFALSRGRGHRIATASIEGLDASYSNVGFMGIPLCLLVFGPDSLPAAVIATLLTACVLFLGAHPARGDGVARVLPVRRPARLGAPGRVAERVADRIGAVHDRQAVRTAAGRHLRCDPGLARGLGGERVGSRRLSRIK